MTVLRSPPMLINKMSSMLVVSVGRGKSGRGGSEDSYRLMVSLDDMATETLHVALFRMSVYSCMSMTMRY